MISSGIFFKKPIRADIAFLIEGSDDMNDIEINALNPEVTLACDLAKGNNCEYFDTIVSFNAEHIGALLKNKDEKAQQLILLYIYYCYISNFHSEIVIDGLLKNSYYDIFGFLPKWLDELNDKNIDIFIHNVVNKFFNGSEDDFALYRKAIHTQSIKVANELSAQHLLRFVCSHPRLQVIYGLIGEGHIDMLDARAEIKSQDKNFRHLCLEINNRKIDIYLYGGVHGDLVHFKLLEDNFKKHRSGTSLLPKIKI